VLTDIYISNSSIINAITIVIAEDGNGNRADKTNQEAGR